jgi:hypothetical protein
MREPVTLIERSNGETYVVIDPLKRISLVGMRFRDPVTGRFVTDGLSVEAFQDNRTDQRVAASPNRSGVFAFHHLPGMVTFEWETEEETVESSPPCYRTFVAEVTADNEQYLPMQKRVRIPLTIGSPPGNKIIDTDLFSSSVRMVPPGQAVVRAELYDLDAKHPASWALVTITHSGILLGRGVADKSGRVVLVFPYPIIEIRSPIGNTRVRDREWMVRLQVYYTPSQPVPRIPDINIVETQLLAEIELPDSSTVQYLELPLKYGTDLIVRNGSSPQLYVKRAGSPP